MFVHDFIFSPYFGLLRQNLMSDVRHDLPAYTFQVLGLLSCATVASVFVLESFLHQSYKPLPHKARFALEIINKAPKNIVVYLQQRSPFALQMHYRVEGFRGVRLSTFNF